MNKTLLLAGAACLISLSANAAEISFQPYVGMDYSYSKLKYDDIKSSIDGYPVVFDSNNMKDTNNSLSLVAGAKFHPNFGAEIFYQKSDEQDKTRRADGLMAKYSTKFTAYGLDAIGYLPVADKTEILGAVGLAQYKVKGKVGGNVIYGSGDEDGLGVRLGAGAQYNFTDHIGARAMLRYVVLDNEWVDNITEFSLGIRYTF